MKIYFFTEVQYNVLNLNRPEEMNEITNNLVLYRSGTKLSLF